MEGATLIFNLAIIFLSSSVFGLFLKLLKQPLIIGYLLAGIVLGPFGFKVIENTTQIQELSQFGIALLLFLVGLEFSISKLKSFGLLSFLIGLSQIILTGIFFFFISIYFFGFDANASFYFALAFSFSSTIVVIKFLNDKRDLNLLFGRISIGVLLVQDIVAILSLIFIHGFISSNSTTLSYDLLKLASSFLILVASIFIIARVVLPPIFKQFATNQELLYISSIGWALGTALITHYLGFSLEIGAFLAGVGIANLPFSIEISSRIKTLQLFFTAIFFTTLGLSVSLQNISNQWVIIVWFSVLIILSRFLILNFLTFIHGFKCRTGFMLSSLLSQVSEFSLILVTSGFALGHIDQEIVSIVTMVMIITIVISTYLFENSDYIYPVIRPVLKFFERKDHFQDDRFSIDKDFKNHIIIFGANHLIDRILNIMKNHDMDFVIVDFDPDVISSLKKKGIDAIYGDMSDPEMIEQINIDKAKIVISTTHELHDDLNILSKLDLMNRKCLTYMTAYSPQDALKLYEKGADFVILPNHLSWDALSMLVKDVKLKDYKNFHKFSQSKKEQHIKILKKFDY